MDHTPHPNQRTRPVWSVDTLFEHTQDLLCLTDDAGYLRQVNPAWSRTLGHVPTALPDAPLYRLVDVADQDRLQAAFSDAVATGQMHTVTVRCPDRAGGRRWVEWQISANAELGLVSALGRDISAQRQVEDRLRLFEAMVDQSVLGMTLADQEGRITYANAAMRDAYGYGEAMVGMLVQQVVAPDERDATQAGLAEVRAVGRFETEVTTLCLDGSRRPGAVTARLIYDAEGAPLGTAAIIRDLTDERARVQELAHTTSLLLATLESTSDGILAVDAEGRVTNINQQFLNLWRIPAELAATHDDARLLQYVVDQLTDPGAFIAKVNELYSQPEATSHDLLTFKDGRVFERYSHPQRVAGACIGRVWNFRDISERHRAEAEQIALQEQMIAAQQARLRELSTPLIPIADGVVAMPLIGTIDTARAQQVVETLLEGVAQRQAEVAIIDITGVSVVDTQVANALLRAAQAVRLLGASVVLTGIRPEVAQTLVNLGADLRSIVTCSNLQDGIAFALQQQ